MGISIHLGDEASKVWNTLCVRYNTNDLELFNLAMTLLEKTVTQKELGNSVVVIDSENNIIEVFNLPLLKNIRPTNQDEHYVPPIAPKFRIPARLFVVDSDDDK